MGLTAELIEFCRQSLGELERIITNSETEGGDYRRDHEGWLDWRFHQRAVGIWEKWEHSLNVRLKSLEIPNVRRAPFGKLNPFEEFQPAFRAIEELANGGSLEALEALCQLAICSARAVRQIRRVRYVREHPHPWQKRAGARVTEEVNDAEVAKLLEDVGSSISEEEQDGTE